MSSKMKLDEFCEKLIDYSPKFSQWVHEELMGSYSDEVEWDEWIELFDSWMANGAPLKSAPTSQPSNLNNREE